MDRVLYKELLVKIESNDIKKVGKRLNQHVPEWTTYLEFAWSILAMRRVQKPIVVEIGILDGMQKQFYESLLDAEYIGIDINQKSSATIKGDSSSPVTLKKLKSILDGRNIDLLFIDGLHTYEGVKSDYEIFHPLVKHITAIHDILTPKLSPKDSVGVIRFWEELKVKNKEDTLITIQHHNSRDMNAFNGRPLGIGVLLKDL